MSETFAIAPAGSRPLALLLPLAIVIGGVLVLLLWSALGAQRARFVVTPTALELKGDVYGRSIPRSAILPEGVRRVDLTTERGLAPAWRTMGTGLPGYKAGWYRLHDGSKALLYLTDRSRAVLIPTTLGYDVMLSPRDPDGFIRALGATD